MNDYYNVTGAPATLNRGASSVLRSEFQLVQQGFDKVPNLADLLNSSSFSVDTGTTNHVVCSVNASITDYFNGMELVVAMANTNTGAMTVLPGALIIKDIVRADGTPMRAGDVYANQIAVFKYSEATGKFQHTQNALAAATQAETAVTNATTQAGNSSASATASAASALAALNTYTAFSKVYLGAHTSDPAVDNQGAALSAGALYFKTTAPQIMRAYTGSFWKDYQLATEIAFSPNGTISSTNISDAINEVSGDVTSLTAVVSGKQAADGDLTAIAALTGTGVLQRDAANTWALSPMTGAVMTFAMSTAPTGWLKCNGAAVSRTTYSTLFDAIGTTFGVGDGSTTFALPDLRGEFVRGYDDGRGIDAGRSFGSAQAAGLPNINAYAQAIAGQGTVSTGAITLTNYGGQFGSSGGGTFANLTFSAQASNAIYGNSTTVQPRNVALLYCIKY